MRDSTDPAATGRRVRTFAWFIVVAIALPPIVVPRVVGDGGTGGDWLPWHGQIASILLLGFVLGAAHRWRALQALRSFIIVWVVYLTASVALWAMLDAVGYIAWTDRTPKYRWVTMSVLLISVPALAMLGAARALGFTRTQLNLARGDMRARGLIPGGTNDASWTRLGLCSIAITVAGGSVWIVSVAGDTGDGRRLRGSPSLSSSPPSTQRRKNCGSVWSHSPHSAAQSEMSQRSG